MIPQYERADKGAAKVVPPVIGPENAIWADFGRSPRILLPRQVTRQRIQAPAARRILTKTRGVSYLGNAVMMDRVAAQRADESSTHDLPVVIQRVVASGQAAEF